MRTKFDEELELLNEELIKMGSFCEKAIAEAVAALEDDNAKYINHVFSIDSEIDHLERDIESHCLKLLLQQQPVAKDLRIISAALKMISDMERIGDQASDIAEIVNTMKSKRLPVYITHISEMSASTLKMVNSAIESFVHGNLNLANAVIRMDDMVDALFDRVREELIEIIREDNQNGEICIDYLMIAKYLERIGDHAVNIAEWVIYSILGTH